MAKFVEEFGDVSRHQGWTFRCRLVLRRQKDSKVSLDGILSIYTYVYIYTYYYIYIHIHKIMYIYTHIFIHVHIDRGCSKGTL